MLKKSASGVLNIREAYLVKRRSFRTQTFHASRFKNDEDGLFERPVWHVPLIPNILPNGILARSHGFPAAR